MERATEVAGPEQVKENGTRSGGPQLHRRGTQAVVGAAVAIVGVIAAANPQSAVLRALNHAAPQLADAVPTVITACGAIIAALSQPPRLRRKRLPPEVRG